MSLNRFLSIACIGFACSGQGDQVASFEYVTTYYDDGSLKEVAQKVDGKLNGKAFLFGPDGTKSWEVNYVDDVREGLHLRYLHGRLIAVEHFSNGNLSGWVKYFSAETGCLEEEGLIDHGQRRGLWYSLNGPEIIEIDSYENDSTRKTIYRTPKYPVGTKVPLSEACMCADWQEGVKN